MNSYNRGGRGNGMSDRGGDRGGRGGRGGGRGRGMRGRGGYSDRAISPDRRSVRSDDEGFDRRPFDNYRQPQHRAMSRSISPVDNRNTYDGRQSSGRRDRRELSPSDLGFAPAERRGTPPAPPQLASNSTNPSFPPLSRNDIARMWKLKLEDADEAIRRAEYDLRRARIEKDNTHQAYKEYINTL